MVNAQVSASIDSQWVRSQFPSLDIDLDGKPVVYLDNPAGTQVPARTMEAITAYLSSANSNVHGTFLTSQRTDAMIAEARQGMAAFLGAASPRQIAFGPNMTTLTFAISRAIGRDLNPGDEIVITELDHDSNVSPWRDLAERGVIVKRVPVHPDDCTLDMEALGELLSPRTRLVAVTYASNAVGTVPDLPRIVEMAHSVGALVWVDAVHYGPHGPIDVQALDVDYLACSSYKFFGPHLGILYGKEHLLERLRPYQLRPAPHTVPEKFETGTKNHECIAGLVATLDYLEELGRRMGGLAAGCGQREALSAAMHGIREYEKTFTVALLDGLQSVPGLRVYGITDPTRLDERVPTFCFTIEGHDTPEIGRKLGERGIFAWTGNYYALDIMERLGLEGKGGAVRVGAVHYNTAGDIEQLVAALQEIAG
ncbi:MAG: cysteine desulfurase-like protein [Chloroflexota bacterium]|nr:cysteine desulfurase-like protein [Chloroflexota bacterium]MDQ5867961.1 cysteine desulfurase-like protein [Chloroflexota bacterium]